MKRSLLPVVVASLAFAGCGSGATQATNYTISPPTTLAGIGITTDGPPPKSSTPRACAHRWNGAANTSGRAAARQRATKADSALVQMAPSSGYFRQYANRCLVYLITPPKSAVVLVETTPGKFAFTAEATGHFSANADLQQDGRLRLR